ncbi:MAG: carbohydrate ABC transporter permease [Clostridiales bacterium]|nr:carbohydrate ABC transporter permease [Clostridiales bacterium]
MRNKNKIKQTFDAFKIIVYSLILVYIASMLYLLFFGALNSVKDWKDFNLGNILGLPSKEFGWAFDNYVRVINEFYVEIRTKTGIFPVYIEEMFLNAFLYAVSMSLFSIATQVMTAYAVSKYNFRGSKFIYMVAVVVMLIPIVGALPSQVEFAHFFNFDNSLIGICIMNCKYPGIYFLVFYAAFKNVSWTYSEAAQIDGAGHLKIFLQIMLPMVGSTIAAVFILYFIQFWNDYQLPMIFLPLKPTVSYGLYKFQNNVNTTMSTPIKLCAAFVSAVPVIILFIAFRNKIMGNVAMGGIKG